MIPDSHSGPYGGHFAVSCLFGALDAVVAAENVCLMCYGSARVVLNV